MASEKRIMPCGGTFRSCDGACWKCSESKAKTDVKTESDDTIYGYNIEHLAMIVRVLQKEGLPPERAAEALIRPGKWRYPTKYSSEYTCSVCGEITRRIKPPYCPWCGASMNEVTE